MYFVQWLKLVSVTCEIYFKYIGRKYRGGERRVKVNPSKGG